MAVLERALIELKRRCGILPAELAEWKGEADANVDGSGIHQSQIDALKDMMAVLQARQERQLNDLSPELSPQEFAERYIEATDEVIGAHDLWRIFRYIFAQHRDSQLKPLADAADLIASDCYLTCMKQARNWGLLDELQFREPPLVYFEAEASPSTASRGYALEALSFPLRRYRNQRLPIPIVLLPSDHATSFWMFCTLHHEVGHNLDQDLKLTGDVQQKLIDRLDRDGVPNERQQQWWSWTGEILADAFGVLLGGAGFAHALTSWLLVLAPAARYSAIDDQDPHPPFYPRIHLITALLRRCGVPAMNEAADRILQMWNAHEKPAWVAAYAADSDSIAGVLLEQKLAKLDERALRQFAPRLAEEAALVIQLADYFNQPLPRPSPDLYSPRLVPVAAQLAFVGLEDPVRDDLGRIHDKALKFLAAIKRPAHLGGGNRREFLQQLSREIVFKR